MIKIKLYKNISDQNKTKTFKTKIKKHKEVK